MLRKRLISRRVGSYVHRESFNSATGYPVYKEPKASEYSIDSAETLDAAGVSVDDNVSAEPASYYPNTNNHLTGYQRTYFLTLPT